MKLEELSLQEKRELVESVFMDPLAIPVDWYQWLKLKLEADSPAFLATKGKELLVESTPYTPIWTAATSNPVLNNGSLTGRFMQLGDIIVVRIAMAAGSTTTFGTGAWRFSLPEFFPSENIPYIGGAMASDSSAGQHYSLLARVPDPADSSFLTLQTTANSPANAVDATTPFAWADTDILRVSGFYEAL